VIFALPLALTVALTNSYAATKSARAMALADCQRQAQAKRFNSRQTIQHRNFLKDCMIDRGFQGDIN
jgi:hypothetical protein